MSKLIELGVKQGCVIGFSAQLAAKSEPFKKIENHIKTGRYGLFEAKGVSLEHLYVVLTQDCTISSGKHIELAQLKKKTVKDQGKIQHLLLGKDYSKLFLKFDGQFYESEEALLTKVTSDSLIESCKNGCFEIKGQLSPNDTRILLDWRTLAYFREPYPDKFNRVLTNYLREEGEWFVDFLRENSHNIHSIRVYVTPENEENAKDYKFSMTALLTVGGQSVEDEISKAIDTMLTQFNRYEGVDCIQSDSFDVESIVYPDALVLSLTSTLDEFTFASAYVMREYNFQYVCY
ncbi:hypothetical protein ACP6H1_25735 [Vibrio harveyi]|uniref:hypothetical protein n=1 Tax=Vibrio harveyi group TaxID=717610 RepID=UPI00215BC98F|nr:hypothetical protein [Vibrio parahaemolyticus]MCR9835708.1 hypothetical protein [Vibrio parahaemolyticus]